MARSFRKQLQSSARLYSGFRERAPKRARVVDFEVPKTVSVMGTVTRIEYTTTHGRKAVLYGHDFISGSRPLFCAAPDGRIFLLGGHYRVTTRGIVDLDASGHVRRGR